MIRRFAPAVPANTAIGAVLLAVVLCAALLSLVWTPYPYAEMNISGKFQGMSSEHWLGTDQYGRDVLSQLMAGAASSMAVAFIAVGLGGLTGAALGMVAASAGGVSAATGAELSAVLLPVVDSARVSRLMSSSVVFIVFTQAIYIAVGKSVTAKLYDKPDSFTAAYNRTHQRGFSLV